MLYKVKCLNCNNEFETRSYTKKYCSINCKNIYSKKRICIDCNKIKITNKKRCSLCEQIKKDKEKLNKIYPLLSKYDISMENYIEMINKQHNKCKSCGCDFDIKRVCIDHDHETGIVRGLLCNQCNSGLGMFKDNIYSLLKAIDYLIEFRDNKRIL